MSTKTNTNNNDQRKLTRVSIPDQPQIFDVHSGAVIGQLVNLSIEGMMSMSPSRIKPGTVLQLRIPLHCCEKVIEVLVGVESLWCDEADESGVCWTGFQIIDVSPEHREIINTLVYE
jgi:hypothetical protein